VYFQMTKTTTRINEGHSPSQILINCNTGNYQFLMFKQYAFFVIEMHLEILKISVLDVWGLSMRT